MTNSDHDTLIERVRAVYKDRVATLGYPALKTLALDSADPCERLAAIEEIRCRLCTESIEPFKEPDRCLGATFGVKRSL